MTIGPSTSRSERAAHAAYEAINAHWQHAETERWSILYNFLMACTILLLAWATVYAGMPPPPTRKCVLGILSIAGAMVSFFWILLGFRANMFIREYGRLGETAEDALGVYCFGPFFRGESIRNSRPDRWTDRLGHLIPSRCFVVLIPGLFAAVYVLLFFVGLSQTAGVAQGPKTDNAAVAAAHDRWFTGLLAEDTTALDVIMAPDLTLQLPGVNEMVRAQFLNLLQTGHLYYDSAEHHETRIRLYGDTGIVTGRSTLTFRFQGKPGSKPLAYTAVYVRTGTHWKLVAWHSTIAQE